MQASWDVCKVSYMWSELITDNKNLRVFLLVLTQKLLRSLNQSSWFVSQPLIKKEWCCLSGPRSQLQKIMFPAQMRRNKERGSQRRWWEIWELLTLYYQRNSSLMLGNAAHAGSFCFGQTSLKQETNHHLHLLLINCN